MPDVSRPEWLAELIGIVQRLCPVDSGSASATDSGKARNIGRVSPDSEKGDGWFWLSLTGRPTDSDLLEDAYLAPADGAGKRRYQLIEAVQDGNLLKLRVGAHAPREGLFLWIQSRGKGFLEKSLLAGLSRIDRFDLVNRFGAGRADPVPALVHIPSGVSSQGPNRGQVQALAACRAPGVNLVWGPPGTGKTEVIALALQDLISRGKNVLLVSSTNVAVDNALGRAAQSLNPVPGEMVRVGIPQVQTVADDSRICLQKMIRDRQEALDRQRRRLEEQITRCRSGPDVARLVEARKELAGFDRDAYQRALDRLANQAWLSDKVAEFRQAQQQAAEAAAAAETGRQRRDDLCRAHEQAGPAREHIRRAEELSAELSDRELDRNRAAADALRLDGERKRLADVLGLAVGLRQRRERKQLSDLLADTDRRLAAAKTRRGDTDELLSAISQQLIPKIETHRSAAHPFTVTTLSQLDADLAASYETVRQAEAACLPRVQMARALSEQVDFAQQQPQPEPMDVEIVSRARDCDLPGKLAELPSLERRAAAMLAEIEKLEGQHEQVVSELAKQARRVGREIIGNASVVATTLAKLRITPEIYEREYDRVIVDEVAAACPPEVIYAASRATEGVTLLGDFLQNGPIVPDKFERSDDRGILRWYHHDCFAVFGISDPASAQANPGCVVLTDQYRFGPVINELANAVAYRGVLQVAGHDQSDKEQEVVLVDVDGLGDDLAQVRPNPGGSGQWWPVGALLARALAARHVSRAEQTGQAAPEKVAIITPYRVQQELIQNMLSESDTSPQIEAGTAYRFQGREFDTVIFDLVEDGTGWIAQGRMHAGPRKLSGLRTFNVGVTRAKRRLYLIANAAAIQRSRTGPLHAVQQLLEAGQIHLVRATEILDLPAEPAGDPIASEVWRALRDHATLIDLYDEDRLPEELCRRIDQAQERIWLWSPWVGQRSEQILPHLRDAADRDVRVIVVILPLSDVNRHLRRRHSELAAQIRDVVFLHKEHQKIIVIDRRLTFIGSMNVLAHRQGGRHEVMALFEGNVLADRMLEQERADELARPPTCPDCGAKVTWVTARGKILHWLCQTIDDDRVKGGCGWTRPFRDRPGTRNQARQP
jgi:hypothetical protein